MNRQQVKAKVKDYLQITDKEHVATIYNYMQDYTEMYHPSTSIKLMSNQTFINWFMQQYHNCELEFCAKLNKYSLLFNAPEKRLIYHEIMDKVFKIHNRQFINSIITRNK